MEPINENFILETRIAETSNDRVIYIHKYSWDTDDRQSGWDSTRWNR